MPVNKQTKQILRCKICGFVTHRIINEAKNDLADLNIQDFALAHDQYHQAKLAEQEAVENEFVDVNNHDLTNYQENKFLEACMLEDEQSNDLITNQTALNEQITTSKPEVCERQARWYNLPFK